MEAFDIVIRFIGFFCTVLVAILGINVFRLKVNQQAEMRLGQIQVETINAQREQIGTLRTQTRLVEDLAGRERLSREQCEEALRLAHGALDTWDQLIGSIWVDANIRAGNGHDALPPFEPRQRTGDAVDPGAVRNEGDEGGAE